MISASASSAPLVSIVTPTFPGREAELQRCVASVLALDWPRIQHVIVSDRTDRHAEIEDDWDEQFDGWARRTPSVAAGSAAWHRYLTFVELNETWRTPVTSASTGSYPWMIGSRLAMGSFVGFLGDDDEYLPEHVSLHVSAMIEHDAMWSLSRVEFRVDNVQQAIIPYGVPSYNVGDLDTTGIMCRVDALWHGIWDANGSNAGDHQMVTAWRDAGLPGVFVDQVTGIHNDGWMAGKSGRPDKPE